MEIVDLLHVQIERDSCPISGEPLLSAQAGEILPVGASAHVPDDALRTDEKQPTQTQPATQPCWLCAQTEQRNDATNLMRGVTNVRTRDCGRGCDVVGACHTLFLMARTYYVTATPRVLHMATSGENRGQPEGSSH